MVPPGFTLDVRASTLEEAMPIIREAALRLVARGEMLWDPADLTVEALRSRVSPGDVFVGKIGRERAIAAFLQERDLTIWPGVEDSLIVHKLAVRDRFVGQGVAAAFLDWASRHAAERKKGYLRRDTDATRPKVCAFYAGLGFRRVGTKVIDDFTCALFERPTA
jgi:GNAT superfamily N-acetyltransferase